MSETLLIEGSVDSNVKKLDPFEVYKLRLQNRLTFPQIAGIFGCSAQAAHQCFTKFSEALGETGDVEAYTNAKQALFSQAEERLIASCLDPDKLAKASLNNIAYAFTQIHTALRLETGKSTQNISTLSKLIGQADAGLFKADNSAHMNQSTVEPLDKPSE